MSGPKFNDDAYYDQFSERSFIAATGVNKTVFTRLYELADVGAKHSLFRSKIVPFYFHLFNFLIGIMCSYCFITSRHTALKKVLI